MAQDDFKVEIDLTDLPQPVLKVIKDALVKSMQFEAAVKVREVEKIIENINKMQS